MSVSARARDSLALTAIAYGDWRGALLLVEDHFHGVILTLVLERLVLLIR